LRPNFEDAGAEGAPCAAPLDGAAVGGDNDDNIDDARESGDSADGDAPQNVSAKTQKWRSRGPGWKNADSHKAWNPHFMIHCARMAFELSSCGSLREVCRIAAKLLCPEKDLRAVQFPCETSIRGYVIKLDLLHSLHRRELYSDTYRVARFLSYDSSPQPGRDYLCTCEEVMVRPLPIVLDRRADGTVDPFAGFTFQRRTMPMMSIARGQSSAWSKMDRVGHGAMLEAGTENMLSFRMSVKGNLTDQGTERSVRLSAWGPSEDVRGVVDALKRGALRLNDEAARNITFLMNSLDQTGVLHVIFNALETALKKVDEWQTYEDGLRAACKVAGEPSRKEILLDVIFADSPRDVRHRVHRFSAAVVDWRWETLEEVLEQFVDLHNDMGAKRDEIRTAFKDEGKLCTRLTKFLGTEFNSFFNEFVHLFTQAVGKDARWFIFFDLLHPPTPSAIGLARLVPGQLRLQGVG
jgi:hypothetical protein